MSWWKKFKKDWAAGKTVVQNATNLNSSSYFADEDLLNEKAFIDSEIPPLNFEYDWTGRVRFTSTSDNEIWINKTDLIQLINERPATHRSVYLLNRIKGIGLE